MRRVFLLLPLLAGCATGPSLQTRMISYMGAPEEKLVQSLGVPDKQISVNGINYLAYIRQTAQVQPAPIIGFGGFGPWGYGPYGGGFAAATFPSQIQVFSCETTFTIKNDHVANVSFKGNDCS